MTMAFYSGKPERTLHALDQPAKFAFSLWTTRLSPGTFLTRGLSSYPNIEVVGYAVNALDARGKISSLAPDVMTLDVEMPGTNGIDFLKELLPVTLFR